MAIASNEMESSTSRRHDGGKRNDPRARRSIPNYELLRLTRPRRKKSHVRATIGCVKRGCLQIARLARLYELFISLYNAPRHGGPCKIVYNHARSTLRSTNALIDALAIDVNSFARWKWIHLYTYSLTFVLFPLHRA